MLLKYLTVSLELASLCLTIALYLSRVYLVTQLLDIGCTIVEALETATLHPARALGIDSYKGVLSFGADADFVLLNDKLEVLSTWISGECVQRT